MNLGVMETAVRSRMGIPTDDAMYTDTPLDLDINSAIHHIESLFDWPWLEAEETIAAVAGTDNYAPIATWLRTIALQIGDYPSLQRIGIEELRAMSASAGRPFFYAVNREKLWVRPVPAVNTLSFTHTYIRTETDLANDADLPLMPAIWHQAVVEFAAHLGFRRLKKSQQAQEAKADFDGWVQRMLARHGRDSQSKGGGLVATPAAPVAAPLAGP